MDAEKKKPASKIRLNRADVKQGLKQIPIERIINTKGEKRSLTTKQLNFARSVAMGDTQAQAYRKAYNTKAKPKTVGDNASRLASDSRISSEITAFKVAMEAVEYQKGERLKAFIMHQLTLHALNEDNPPASRIRSLELLGKSYDVGLFVERKEITTINNSADAKAKLIDKLREAMKRNSISVDYKDSGESLLDELTGKCSDNASDDDQIAGNDRSECSESASDTPTPSENEQNATHATRTPFIEPVDGQLDTHSISHNQSHKNQSHKNVTVHVNSEGVGSSEIVEGYDSMDMETPPVSVSGSPE